VRVRNRVSDGRISRSEFKTFAFQFLSEYFLSLLWLCLVLVELADLPPIEANDFVVWLRVRFVTYVELRLRNSCTRSRPFS
jgi:hypothetical protein